MISPRTSKLFGLCLILWCVSFHMPIACAQANGNAARIVVWQPKLARDFEEGYKRHLEWHRRNGDSWTWHGWTMLSGERPGYFVDGTFFHAWNDLDSPVNPAADAADNAVNVFSYAELRSAAIYEAIPALSNLGPPQLASPLLTFCHFDIQPGKAAEFESLIAAELRTPQASAVRRVLLRPVNGASEYLLLLPGEKQSDLGPQAEFSSRLLQTIARDAKGDPVVLRFHSETARYRPDLSYTPGEKSK
jgi:hypothetical protein